MSLVFYIFALFIHLQIGFYGISANLLCQNQSTGEIVEYLEGNFWAELYKNAPQDPLIEHLLCDLSQQDSVILEGSQVIDQTCRAQDDTSMEKFVDLLNNLRHWASVVKNEIITSSNISLQNDAIQQLKTNLSKLAIILGQDCQISAQEIAPIKELDQVEILRELAILWFQQKERKREESDKDRCKSEGRLVQLMANLANEGAIGDLGKAKDRRRRRRKKRGDIISNIVIGSIIFILAVVALTFVCWRVNRVCGQSSSAPAGGGSSKEGSVKIGGGSVKLPSINGGSNRWSGSGSGRAGYRMPDFGNVPPPPPPGRNPPLYEYLFYPWAKNSQHGQP